MGIVFDMSSEPHARASDSAFYLLRGFRGGTSFGKNVRSTALLRYMISSNKRKTQP